MKKKMFPFKYKMGILMFAVVWLISSLLAINQYLYLENIQEAHFEQSKKLVADRVMNSVSDADYLLLTVERQLEKEAREVLTAIRAHYEETGELDFDLEAFIPEGYDLDLYVIDEHNRIVQTTDPVDLGLDFNQFPSFAERLNTIRHTDSFVSDRMSQSVIEGEMKKFCYWTSSDGKYIFETGSLMARQNNVLLGAGFDNFEQRIVAENSQFVESITMYDYTGLSYRKDGDGLSYQVDEPYQGTYQQAFQTMEPVEQVTKEAGRSLYHLYIPYAIAAFQGINDINVIEIVYHDQSLRQNLRQNAVNIALMVLAGALLAAAFSFFLATRMTRPINQLYEASSRIAAGKFDSVIRINSNDEMELFGRQFQQMADNIRDLLEERYQQEWNLERKNREILEQKEEITVLYEETSAMNEELEHLLDENRKNYFETVWALANSMEIKDAYTGGHCERVMEYAMAIGKELNLGPHEMNELKFGSILHDIGKIGISEEILNKPGSFTEADYALMKKHPEMGGQILKDVHFLERSSKIVTQHHERVDGKGYPYGLQGEEIDLLARIVCVADAYDAMTSNRSYRKHVLTQEEAIQELVRNRGTQFDEQVIDVFVAHLQRQSPPTDPM